jgi:hypothetical protein
MTIKSFIQDEVLLPRLKENGLLVVYDPDQRYRELCAGIATETTVVVDAGQSSIEARDLAMATLQKIGRMDSEIEAMLVYIPARPPLTDEEKQHDPFALYTVCGSVFPDGEPPRPLPRPEPQVKDYRLPCAVLGARPECPACSAACGTARESTTIEALIVGRRRHHSQIGRSWFLTVNVSRSWHSKWGEMGPMPAVSASSVRYTGESPYFGQPVPIMKGDRLCLRRQPR